MEPTLIAYMAGILDGEGNVGCYKRKDELCRQTIRLEMTAESIPRLFKETFGGAFTSRDRSAQPGRANEKRTYIWGVDGKKARGVYAILKPYLRLKHLPERS